MLNINVNTPEPTHDWLVRWSRLKMVLQLLALSALFSAPIIFILMRPDPNTSKFKLQDGSIVTCRGSVRNQCGYSLSRCTDGRTYECQTNVIGLGDRE